MIKVWYLQIRSRVTTLTAGRLMLLLEAWQVNLEWRSLREREWITNSFFTVPSGVIVNEGGRSEVPRHHVTVGTGFPSNIIKIVNICVTNIQQNFRLQKVIDKLYLNVTWNKAVNIICNDRKRRQIVNKKFNDSDLWENVMTLTVTIVYIRHRHTEQRPYDQHNFTLALLTLNPHFS